MSCIAAAGLIPLRAAPVRRAASAKSSKVRTRFHSYITHCDPLVFLRLRSGSRESRGVGVRTRAPMPRAASVRAYTRREARRRESKLAFRDATRFVFRRATRHRRVPADRIHRGPRFTTLRTNQSVTGPTRGDARAVRPGRCVGPPRAMRPRRCPRGPNRRSHPRSEPTRPARARPDLAPTSVTTIPPLSQTPTKSAKQRTKF